VVFGQRYHRRRAPLIGLVFDSSRRVSGCGWARALVFSARHSRPHMHDSFEAMAFAASIAPPTKAEDPRI
jgi:hypothetical protein